MYLTTTDSREIVVNPGFTTTDMFGAGPGRMTLISIKNANASISIHISDTPPPSLFTPLKSKVNRTDCSLMFLIKARGEYYAIIENSHSFAIEMQIWLDIIEPIVFWGFIGLMIALIGVGTLFTISYLRNKFTL